MAVADDEDLTPELWQRIQVLFHSALQLPPVDRAAFLEQACGGDPLLQQRVEALVEADTDSDALGSPWIAFPTIGKEISHYQIQKILGSGGMGEVYLAKDTRLDRLVALKILPPNFAQNEERMRRFLLEARAASAVNHSNVAHIYEIGEVNGVHFIAMEFVEGETLAEIIRRGSSDFQETVHIGIQISRALEAAHSRGIIHRDLKPANIIITPSGDLKLLDFGVAKLSSREDPISCSVTTSSPAKTQAGLMIGTVPYCSPEQLLGGPVDRRTDFFSLGVVLYQVVTQRLPFEGSTNEEIAESILHNECKAPDLLNRSTPQSLSRVLMKLMAKDPNDRYDNAGQIISALEMIQPVGIRKRFWWALLLVVAVLIIAGLIGAQLKEKQIAKKGPVTKIESLVVLPLKNLSGDSRNDYFADGVTEELSGKLAQIGSLRVISRTSVLEYKERKKPLQQIARELQVDAFVEGSVFLAGDRVTITTQLLEGTTGRLLWAESHESDLQDILKLQNDVALSIAREVRVKLVPWEEEQLAKGSRVHPAAYQAYLRGLSYSEGDLTPENIFRAVKLFERTVELDPDFAVAWAELSRAYSYLYFFFSNPEDGDKARAAVDRVFQLQSDLPDGHVAFGYYYYRVLHDYDRALEEFKIAQQSLPNDKAILSGQASIYRRQGKWADSLEVFQRLFARNPRDPMMACDVGFNYSFLRKYPEAQRYFHLCISLGPDLERGYAQSASNYVRWKGDTKMARDILNQALFRGPDILLNLFVVERSERNYQAALDVLSEMAARPGKEAEAGIVYLLMKRPELARASFEAARAEIEKELRATPAAADSQSRLAADLHSRLGFAYAGLGLKAEAIREGKRAVELVPVSRDALWGPGYLESLATIYIMVGEQDAALDQVQFLLSIPSNLTISKLRIDPLWDSLRNHPRFQKLLEN